MFLQLPLTEEGGFGLTLAYKGTSILNCVRAMQMSDGEAGLGMEGSLGSGLPAHGDR